MTRGILTLVAVALTSMSAMADTPAHEAQAREIYAHGLNERLPVRSFYEGIDHIYRLAVELGGAKRAR